MKKDIRMIISLITLLAASLLVTCPISASAQLLLDQFMSSSSGAQTETGSLGHQALSADEIAQRLQKQGYSNITASPSDPQQFTAISPAGTSVVVTVEPKTGQVLAATPQ